MKTATIFLLACICFANCFGQDISSVINIGNGLQSNHVYNLLVDQAGYLWIATDKGIARYNGYEMRHYTQADGLYNEDIWSLHEDKIGRIWLSSIAGGFAYIYHDSVFNAVTPTAKTIYPKSVVDYYSGIAFTSQYFSRDGVSLCIIKNDTIQSFDLSKFQGNILLQDQDKLIQCSNDTIRILYYEIKNGHLYTRESSKFSCDDIKRVTDAKTTFIFKNYLVFQKQGDSLLFAIDLLKRSCNRIRLPESSVKFSFASKDHIYVFGRDKLFQLDTSLHLSMITPLSELAGDTIDGANCSYFINDNFWGKCLATNKGLFITPRLNNPFSKFQFDLNGYKKVGMADETTYWWNSKNRNLRAIRRAGTNTHHLDQINNITGIVGYNGDSLLIFNIDKICWYNQRAGSVTSFFKPFKKILQDGKMLFDTTVAAGGINAIVTGSNCFYMVSQTRGFCRYSFKQDSLSITTISFDRYSGILYDKQDNYVVIYKPEKVEFYRNDIRRKTLDRRLLQRNGISSIQQVLTDSYGNIFIKDYRHLAVYNFISNKFERLFTQYPLDEAQVLLDGSRLVVAGKFGILTSKVKGLNEISAPILADNFKLSTYSQVNDIAVRSDSIVVNADRGAYSISLSYFNSGSPLQSQSPAYKIVLNYGEVSRNIADADTIQLHHSNLKLLFDVINPGGVGKLEQHFSIDGSAYTTNSGELDLRSLQPDQYYELDVSFSDEVWHSKTTRLYVYLVPHWWQKRSFYKWIVFGYLLSASLVLSAIIYLAVRVITRRQHKRNELLSLELKAIHAQINPHFIYNSLSATIFFITHKMLDEAVDHIHKFSDLLRAYVKSSRTKVISIAEEVTNLRNYIELQQTRFQHKFDYAIFIAPDIDTNEWYIPSLLLQPIVENAINHGLFHKRSQGLLELSFKRAAANELIIIVADNGVGREQSRTKEAKKTESYGSELINDLITIFNRYEKMRINIRYIERQPASTGTIVEVLIVYT